MLEIIEQVLEGMQLVSSASVELANAEDTAFLARLTAC